MKHNSEDCEIQEKTIREKIEKKNLKCKDARHGE